MNCAMALGRALTGAGRLPKRLDPNRGASHDFPMDAAGAAVCPGPKESISMATAAPTQSLPLFYNAIEPLNFTQHGKMKVRPMLRMPQIAVTHAIPVTVDEFTLVQRHYPIVFSIGDNPIPIALMALN